MFYAITYYFKKFSLIIFFILAYAISWAAWIPLSKAPQDHSLLTLAGSFGPTLAGLLIIALTQGSAGLRSLGRRVTAWRVSPLWYAVALAGGPLLAVLALAIHTWLGGAAPVFRDPAHVLTSPAQWYLGIVVFLYILVFSVLGEEIGWRGYALPRLQSRKSALSASLIVGLAWAFWHLPLFWTPGDVHQRLPLGWFLLQILGSSILYTWMLNRTRGSLLMVCIFHAACNAAIGLLPILPLDTGGSLRPLWILLALQWTVVFGVIAVGGAERLARGPHPLVTVANPVEG